MRVFSPLLLLLLLLPGAPALSGCDSQGGRCTSADSFEIEDITPEGAQLGETAVAGSCVDLTYVGRLADGAGTFDEGEITKRFLDRRSRLIPGFYIGATDQRVGQTRRVTVPPDLGYRDVSQPARDGTVGGVEGGEPYVGIPSCSTLEFDIRVTKIHQDPRVCSQ